jgi:hypothetical protein
MFLVAQPVTLQLDVETAVEGGFETLQQPLGRVEPALLQGPGERALVAAGQAPKSRGVLLQELPVDPGLALGAAAGGGGQQPAEVAVAGAVGDQEREAGLRPAAER